MTRTAPSRYEALGEGDGIRGAVTAFYERVLGATMDAAGAGPDSIGAVVAALSPLRSSIVSA